MRMYMCLYDLTQSNLGGLDYIYRIVIKKLGRGFILKLKGCPIHFLQWRVYQTGSRAVLINCYTILCIFYIIMHLGLLPLA